MDKSGIFPAPKYFKLFNGSSSLSKKAVFEFKAFNEKKSFFEKEYLDALNEKERNLKLNFNVSKSIKILICNFSDVLFNETYKALINEYDLLNKREGYLIEINKNNIIIAANESKGIYYGLISLLQLINTNDGKLPDCLIADFPSINLRGISDDISRGQVSLLDDFKKIIKRLSRYKLNTYYLYLEDVVEIKAYPDIGLNRGRLSQDEIKELVNYADNYFVEIIPIFQTLGHWENLLIQPNYYELAEFPGSASLDISNEKTYEFLETCIKELSEIFTSKYFHSGCDESWDVGYGKNDSLRKEIGIGRLHLNHYFRINEIIKKYNKKMMMYGDIIHNHPEIFNELPKDIIVVDWRYGIQDYEVFIKKYNDAGIDFICSPSVTNYNRIFPWIENSFFNIKDFIRSSYENRTIGVINSNWGDNGGENLREFNWLGYAFGAECSWNPTNPNLEYFQDNFFIDFFGCKDERIKAVFRMLSDFGFLINQYEFWRHPFLPFRENPFDNILPVKLKGESIKSKAKIILNLIDDIMPKIKLNKEYFDYLRFAAKQAYWYGDKISFSIKVKSIIDGKGNLITEREKQEIISICDTMIAQLQQIKKEFISLWSRTNRQENLNLILKHKYDRQILAWQNLQKNISQNIISYDSRIKSNWIFHPESAPDTKEKPQVNSAIFRKVVKCDNNKTSLMHIISDGYSKIFINSEFIGEVRGKRTLSLLVEAQRIKIFDISKFLKNGENEILVETINFGNNASARINVQIKLDNSIIYSDKTWEVKKPYNNYVSVNELSENNINEPDFNLMVTAWRER